MKEYGLSEPEFVDMEIALRINLYRKSINDEMSMIYDAEKVPDESKKVPNSAGEAIECIGKLQKQHALIYKQIVDKGSITSSEVEILLAVKQRRARAVLKEMVDKGIIKKIGIAQTTKYIIK